MSTTPEKKTAPNADKLSSVPKPRRRPTPDPEALARIAPLAEPQPVATPEPALVREAPAVLAPVAAPKPIPKPVPVATTPPAAVAQPAATTLPATPRPRREPALTPPPVLGPAVAAPTVPAPAPLPGTEPQFKPEPQRRQDAAPRREAVPAWPPPGDRGPLAELPGRVPAGVYLPPSAVLPPGEALPLPSTTNGRTPDPAGTPAATQSGETSERVSAADRLARLEMPDDWPRRVVAIGAVIASLGFILPWTASPVGNDLLGDYWIRWGLAGPGAWIVVAVLVGLAGLTLAGGRLATAPVGLPGVALGMLVLGLSWPYLFGFPEQGVGIWVVISGVLLLAIGGLLDMRAGRHRATQPTV